jgi:hypothetical protein
MNPEEGLEVGNRLDLGNNFSMPDYFIIFMIFLDNINFHYKIHSKVPMKLFSIFLDHPPS